MIFQDLQNEVLFRARNRGVNFGQSIGSTGTDLLSPYYIKLKLNQKYNEILFRTRDAAPWPMKVQFPTTANTKNYLLRPVPNDPNGNPNPCAMRVLRLDYTYAAGGETGQTRRIRGLGTQRFDQATFQGSLRLASFAGIPVVWSQMNSDPNSFDLYPGTATAGDIITLTIVPDPQATGRLNPSVLCANGGPMVNDADVPLIPDEFHAALVEGALADILRALNRKVEADDAKAAFEDYVSQAQDFGVLEGEGESDQVVEDVYPDPLNFV